ncbi:MAG: hemolysin family protein [Sandaracinaceae bacterium]
MPDPLEGLVPQLLAVLVVVAAGSSLSAFEAALTAFGEVRLLAAQEEGGKYAGTAARLLRNKDRMFIRLLTGRTICLVASVALTVRAVSAVAPWWGVLSAVAGVALVYASLAVSFGALARARAATWALPMARYLYPLELVVRPVSAPLGALVRVLDRAFPAPAEPTSDDHAVREVEHMIEQQEESGSLPEEFADLLLSVLEFKDTVAREVMVPRTQMQAIEISTPFEEVLETVVTEGHSRYPVYRERVDQIEGVLYAKDLFRILRNPHTSGEHTLDRIIRRPVFFVAETHKIGQLLREMQSRRFHLAVVVDEFGGTSGIVTLEDILEEIVGEIQDEHDVEEPPILRIGKDHYLVDASVSLYDLGEVLGVELEAEGDFDSVGGMILEVAGRVPSPGESVDTQGFQFQVRDSDERHVTRVEVTRAPDEKAADVQAAAS